MSTVRVLMKNDLIFKSFGKYIGSSIKNNIFVAVMKKYILIILLALMPVFVGKAQETIFRNFSSVQYKGGSQNWDIEQLPDGRIAIANNFGLLFFDGDQWKIYPIRNYSVVRSLYYDSQTARMYAGASGEFGFYKVDPVTYRFSYHSLSDRLPNKERDFGEIWKILPWKGNVVFQSKTHLFILGRDGKLKSIRSHERIEAVANVKGRLVIADRKGLAELRGSRIVPISGASFPERMVVRSLVSHHGRIIISTQQNGLFVYDGQSILPFATELTPILASHQVFCTAVRGSKLAIGTVRCGLIVKDLSSGQTSYLNTCKGLQNNTVLSVMFDARGNIWMGLDNGLSYALLNVPFQNIISERFNIGTGYTSFVHGNILYLGTNQGLFMAPLPLRQQLESRQPAIVSNISGQVWCLNSIHGIMLCGTDRGMFQISGSYARQIAGPDGTWTFCELKSHPGYILATDYLGMLLLKREGNTYRMVHRVKLDAEVSGNLYEDADGTIWMGHWQNGIYHLRLSPDMKSASVIRLYNKENGLVINQNNTLCKIDGTIYISSVDGFYKYDRRSDRLVYDKPFSMIFNTYGTALRLTETPTRDIWAQTQNFIAIAHRKGRGYTVDSISYKMVAKGQQLGIGNLTAIDVDVSLINSSDGFYIVRNHFNNRGKDFPLFIRKVTSTNDGDSVVYRHLPDDDGKLGITLPHSMNSIKIEFVLPEYQSDDAVVYQCYLENYDSRWSSTPMSSKEYTRLSKGSYVFHVKAYNKLSNRTQECRMAITILPAWYETVWAYLVYLVLIGLALYYLVKYLQGRANRELRRVRIENERRMKEQETRLQMERATRKMQVAEMKNEKLQNELKHKSSELAGSTMNLLHQNEMLQKLDEDMHLLSESVRREEKKAALTSRIAAIRNDLQNHMNDDAYWKKFEENFNIVYDDFIKKLTEQYDNLKMSDLKLCAYLRMGLSSKEIASLLNMSVRSVETARYRLRKKLNLEGGDNLTDFMQRFNQREGAAKGQDEDE